MNYVNNDSPNLAVGMNIRSTFIWIQKNCLVIGVGGTKWFLHSHFFHHEFEENYTRHVNITMELLILTHNDKIHIYLLKLFSTVFVIVVQFPDPGVSSDGIDVPGG